MAGGRCREPISRGADVLSAGIGGDITFDLQLAREHDAIVRCSTRRSRKRTLTGC